MVRRRGTSGGASKTFAHSVERKCRSWEVGSITLYFAMASGIYLNARLVSPRIPERGEVGSAFIPRKNEPGRVDNQASAKCFPDRDDAYT